MRTGIPRSAMLVAGRFLQDARGATAAIFAIALPVLAGMAALAIDVGVWTVQKRQAQGAADAAAYSAAVSYKAGNTLARATAEAKGIAAGMGFVDGTGGVTVTVSNPPTAGDHVGNSAYWEVIVRQPQSSGLASLFLSSAPIVSAYAVAGGTSYGNGCMISLGTDAAPGIQFLNGADLTTSNCGLYSNSKNTKYSVACGNTTGNGANGNCTINASVYAMGAVAGIQGISGTVTQYMSSLPSGYNDPYSEATAPSGADCNFTYGNYTVPNSAPSAGTYCITGKLSFAAGATASNVTFILTGSGSSLDTIPNGSDINISAPTSGKYANIAIMSLEASGLDFTTGNNGNGTATTLHIQGAIYVPKGPLSFTGGTIFDSAICTQLVGYSLKIGVHANMGSNCPGPGSGGAGSSSLSLVE